MIRVSDVVTTSLMSFERSEEMTAEADHLPERRERGSIGQKVQCILSQ